MKRILAVTELWPDSPAYHLAYRVIGARTRIQEYSLGQISISLWPPGGGGVKFFGVKCVTTHKRHIYTSWGSYMCNMKRILQAVTELRAGQEYNLDPLGDKVMGSNESFPPKGTSRPPRGPTCAVCKESSSGYRVMARTRIFTWANKHITLTPWGSSFSGSNMSQPPKGTSRPPRGPTCAIWKESSKRLQSYGPDKNITLTPWGTRSWGQMSPFPQKAHLDPLGVLHVQYEKNPPSGYWVMGRTRIFPDGRTDGLHF